MHKLKKSKIFLWGTPPSKFPWALQNANHATLEFFDTHTFVHDYVIYGRIQCYNVPFFLLSSIYILQSINLETDALPCHYPGSFPL